MSKKYIEIDSSFRDRNLYPNVGEFQIQVSQISSKARLDADDPVSDQAPLLVFNASNFNTTSGAATFTATSAASTINLAGAMGDTSTTLIVTATDTVNHTLNYYVGCIAYVSTTVAQRITGWEYLYTIGGTQYFAMKTQNALTVTIGTTTMVIKSGTDVTSDTSNPLIYIPTGKDIDNYYISYLLYNQTMNQYRPIATYSGITRLARLDTSTLGAVSGWANTDTFVLRKALPYERGTAISGGDFEVDLAATASEEDEFYTNSYIRFTSGAAGLINEQRLITEYDGANQTAYFDVELDFDLTGITYEILYFTRDNARNLNFFDRGSSSREDAPTYEIELYDLALPNVVLQSGKGGKPCNYPHMYLEIRNESQQKAIQSAVLNSNNLNTIGVAFRVPMDDASDRAFVKNDSDSAKQLITFRVNDYLRFVVHHPDGSIFKPAIADNTGALEPNPNLQISGLLEIRKLEVGN